MKNDITNTLFKFISARAPQLADLKDNKGFITQPKDAEGHFNTAIANKAAEDSKYTALHGAAKKFQALSLEEIKALDGAMYKAAVWFAKHKRKATEAEVKDILNNLSVLTNEQQQKIWQNLYYQVITQKDFYAKEALMQLLLANHILANHNKAAIETLLKAKVILPKALFIEDKTTTSSSKSAPAKSLTPKFANPAMQKHDVVATLQADNKALHKLQRELKMVETKYQADYKREYNKQRLAHEQIVKPIMAQYQQDVATAKANWCSTASGTYDANDPCKQPPTVPMPELPEFTFNFRDPLDASVLQTQLSSESLAVYNALVDPSVLQQTAKLAVHEQRIAQQFVTLDFSDFNTLNSGIQDLIDANTETIVAESDTVVETTVVVGGTPLEVATNSSNLAPFEYEFKTRTISLFNSNPIASLMVGVPATWSIQGIQYTLVKNDDTEVSASATNVLQYPSYNLFKNLSLQGITSNFKRLEATLQFTNGQERSFTISNVDLTSIYKGMLDAVVTTPSNDTDTDVAIAPDTPFIPKGYGVKQLGIADYNKVEQTIHGYIEGEVAHIENIMAREFKEKSTKRLRQKDSTVSKATEQEREKLTDTTTADRYEMQSEVANVLQNSSDFNAGVNVNAQYEGDPYTINAGAFANYATHNASEESTVEAVTAAQEVTERTLDRIITKVKEERVDKIVESFEENNTHGFDNRKGDKHVVGVFRWVDKIFKNQVLNYGKRLMFEFMVPEPAKLHKLALQGFSKQQQLQKPQDPRTASVNTLSDYSQVTTEAIAYWASQYNVALNAKPEASISVSKGFHGNFERTGIFTSGADTIIIPEGYEVNAARASVSFDFGPPFVDGSGFTVNVGDKMYNFQPTLHTSLSDIPFTGLGGVQRELSVAYKAYDCGTFTLSVVADCTLTPEALNQWKQDTFNAIITAYEEAVKEYNNKLITQQTQGVQILGDNPGFYRQIENTVLRKNCISYLIDQNPDAALSFGKQGLITTNDGSDTVNLANMKVAVGADLDRYSSFVKFMEQAFEWDIMSYHFYPYYWANRNAWSAMYQYNDTHDHLFKAFMQSGMARVIVTVRPGFEEAVRYYMQTGQIWNGGEVPVIEDELYLSIVEELRQPKGEALGKAWWTRVPTALTILQAESIGLKVDKALPYNDDLSDFEDPDTVPQSNQIKLTEAQVGGDSNTGSARLFGRITGNNGIEAKILLKRIDGFIQDLTYTDTNGHWELNNLPSGRFELFIDVDNDLPNGTYEVTTGSKEQVVELDISQTLEVNITVAAL